MCPTQIELNREPVDFEEDEEHEEEEAAFELENTETLPPVGLNLPRINFSRVLFPEPEGPSRA